MKRLVIGAALSVALLTGCASAPSNIYKTQIAAKTAYQVADGVHDELCKAPVAPVTPLMCHKAFVVLKADYVILTNSVKLLAQYESTKDKKALDQATAGLPQLTASVQELVQLVQDLKNGK